MFKRKCCYPTMRNRGSTGNYYKTSESPAFFLHLMFSSDVCLLTSSSKVALAQSLEQWSMGIEKHTGKLPYTLNVF